jgi:exosortase A
MKVESEAYLSSADIPLLKASRSGVFAAAITVAAVIWLLLWYAETSASMVAIWWRSETFAHGFLIFPISAWLIWDKRRELAQVQPAPSPVGVVALAMLGTSWLLANIAGVQVVQQYALIGMIAALVLATLGWQTVRVLAFPLAFLFLAVPVGEGLLLPLMNITADFTVTALRLTGMPVYREGTFFSIPSGNWSVVEGCSGLRYLIASFTGGCIFAYLSYRTLYKRLLFVAASIVVPIIANGLRAYMIVMIAHLSDMRLALGIDHLIYGWVFFGFVMLLLFWVGSFWREGGTEHADKPGRPAAERPAIQLPRLGAVALISILVAGIWPLYAARLEGAPRFSDRLQLQPPAGLAGWELDSDPLTKWGPRYVGMDASLFQVYRKGDSRVALYLAMYRQQRQDAELINARNIMIVQKHPVWGNIGERRRVEPIGPFTVPVRETRLRSPGQRLLIWDWLYVGDRHLSDPYYAKLLLVWDKLLGRPDDGVAIMVITPSEQQTEPAEKVLRAFVTDMLPAIEQTLRTAAGDSRER